MSVYVKQELRDVFIPFDLPTQPLYYRFNGMGCNSQGNHYVKVIDSFGRRGYHYVNANGTYYVQDTDGTEYYNDGYGFARVTCRGGPVMVTNESQFRFKDFKLHEFDLGFYLQEFQSMLEEIKKEEPF